jgi:DNA-binding SARP family transcriptional activator
VSADRHDRARDERDLVADALADPVDRAALVADIHDLVADERDLVPDQQPVTHPAQAPCDPDVGSTHAVAPRSPRRLADPGNGAVGSRAVNPASGPTPAAGAASPREPAARPVTLTAARRVPLPEAALFTIGLLAGGALASLNRLRHRRRQRRRPGGPIALPTEEAGWRAERKLRVAAASDAVGRWLSRSGSHSTHRAGRPGLHSGRPANWRAALRELSEALAADGEPLPPIAGVHVTDNAVEVLLCAPATKPPPPPFLIGPARQDMCWSADLASTGSAVDSAPPSPGELGDLLPGLFTAGGTEAGGYLLLDLEAIGVIGCDGLADLTDRLLVTAATELAASRWRAWYDLILVGCGELEVLGRAEMCGDLNEALDVLEARAEVVDRRLRDGGPTDVRERRLADPEDEDWGLALLVSRVTPTPAQMSRLLELADGPSGMAALVPGDTQGEDGKLAPALLALALAPERNLPDQIVATLSMNRLGLHQQITLWPQALTVAEYEALVGVFGVAARTEDVGQDAQPDVDYGGPPWIRFAAAPIAPLEDADRDGEGLSWDLLDVGEPAGDEPAVAERSSVLHVVMAANVLAVKVLGPVEITGPAEPLQAKQAELVLALALHAPVGLSNSALCSLLGSDADHPRPSDSVRQLITRTRRNLGRATDGQERIIHLGSGIYVLHDEAKLDWAVFSDLARRGRAARSVQDMRAALRLVRGQPFADCYHWWIDVALVETIRAEIVDAAELLASIELAAGNPLAAGTAARAGLAAESAAEQLWRALMRAESAAGNPDGVVAAWTGCLDAIAEIAPGAAPHPDTERLFRLLAGDAAPAGLR